MVSTWKGTKNTQLSSNTILILSILLFLSLIEAKVLNCRPLPQCCRRYVFSPACRGVAAKRNIPETTKGNEDFIRDPRMFSLDSDYGNENDFRNLVGSLPDEDFRGLNHLKNPVDEHVEYVN